MTNDTKPSTRFQRFAHWRALTLVGACVGSGLLLDMVVLGSGPDDPTASAVEAVAVSPVVDAPATEPVNGAIVPAPTVTMPPVESTTTAISPPVTATSAAAAESATAVVASPAAVSPTPAPPSPTVTPTPMPATASPATASPTTIAVAPAPSITYPIYEVPGIANVVLAFADESRITLWSVSATQGWVYEVDHDGPLAVVVEFFNTVTHDEAKFQAELEGNRIKVEVEANDEDDADHEDADDDADDDEHDDEHEVEDEEEDEEEDEG